MRQWRVGTLSMGILLVVAGVLLIVQKINGSSSLEIIFKWWPVILVLLGIEILAYSYFSKEEIPKIKYDGVSIFIVIVLIIFSTLAYIFSTIPFNGGRMVFNNGFTFGSGNQSEYTKKYTVDSKNADNLKLANAFGNIDVEKSDNKNIEVSALIRIMNNDEEYAKKISEKIIAINHGGTINIEAKTKQGDYDRFKVKNINVDLKVKVPSTMDISVTDEFGDVYVNDAGKALSINNRNGQVSVNSVGGDLKIDDQFGNVEAASVAGKCEINNRNGQIDVKNTGKDLRIINQFGDVEFSGIKGNADIKDKNAAVNGSGINGNINIENQFGNISLEDIGGSAEISDKNGSVEIRNAGSDVKIDNEYGNIKVANAGKAVVLTDKNGQIEFESDKILEKDMRIDNKYGNITIRMAHGQNGYIKAYTEYGDISNNYDLKVNEKNNEKTIDDKLGSGGINIDLKNKNGNIDIE